jgi:hypothetical protein
MIVDTSGKVQSFTTVGQERHFAIWRWRSLEIILMFVRA